MCNKKDKKSLTNDYTYSDELLEQECRQAFIRINHPEPSVHKEWDNFTQKKLEKNQPKKRSTYFIFGTLSGVAATVLLFLLFIKPNSTHKDIQPITVFMAQQGIQNITVKSANNQGEEAETSHDISPNTDHVDYRGLQEAKTKIKTISTPYGKDFRIVLSDGTEVLMNANSKLTFPTRFEKNQRIVKLLGEAYFKVAKNKKKPFIVKTDQTTTRALGTEFNVKAYNGFAPHITLVEGSVAVSNTETKNETILKPGEDYSFINNNVSVKEVDTDYYTQWKEGYFYFDNVPLVNVLSELGRWYNINIEIEKPELMSYRLHFIVNRNVGIDEAIQNLNNFNYLHAEKTDGKLIIRKKIAKERD